MEAVREHNPGGLFILQNCFRIRRKKIESLFSQVEKEET